MNMKNFFNAIGVADMERVHSAMIAWILDDENDSTSSAVKLSKFTTFPIKERSCLLCELFGETFKVFKRITTHVEWNDIDIVIDTEDNRGVKEVWVIENKLKSQEHMSNEKDVNGNKVSIWQTIKYENIIQSSFPRHLRHYMLLSLMGDKAKSTSGCWKSTTYDGLQALLNSMQTLKKYVLINEYANAITKMTQELRKFLNATNFSDHPHVFNKLKKTQIATAKITTQEQYIVENGLETIFQKCFLQTIIPQTKFSPYEYSISETHGTALVDFNPCPIINGTSLGIQFQNGSFKVGVCLIIDKNTLNKNKLIEDFWNKWKGILNGSILGLEWGNPNKSRGENLPYFSFSIKEKNVWYAKQMKGIEAYWNRMHDECIKALNVLAGYC